MEDSIAHLVIKVKSAFSTYLNRKFSSMGLDLNTEQFVVLMILWERSGQRQQDIADRTGKDKASVARLIASMEKRNLIIRKDDEKDSRQKLIFLTEEGTEIKQKILPVLGMDMRSLHKDISPEEMKTCTKVLKLMYQNLSGQ